MGDSSANHKTQKHEFSCRVKQQQNQTKEKHNYKVEIEKVKNIYTLDKDRVGKDIPKKKPKIIPIKVVMKSLIISLGFLGVPLQFNRGQSHKYRHCC